jgi:Recombination endonuclease VII
MKKPPYPSKAQRLWLHEIADIHNAQRGRCDICSERVPVAGKARALDPLTKRILCKRCSIVIGMACRYPALLRRMADWLDKNASSWSKNKWAPPKMPLDTPPAA